MSRPQTRPANANKHPGRLVANRVQRRSKEEVAAEKNRKQAEKDARTAAINKSRTIITEAEDTMAIQQSIQVTGPPRLVRPRAHVVASSKDAPANTDSQVGSQLSVAGQYFKFPELLTNLSPATEKSATNGQTSQGVKRKHPGLKLNFRDSVNANRRVSNGGVTISASSDSHTHVGSATISDGKIKTS